jgi:hypothetical protein
VIRCIKGRMRAEPRRSRGKRNLCANVAVMEIDGAPWGGRVDLAVRGDLGMIPCSNGWRIATKKNRESHETGCDSRCATQ